MRVFDLTSLAKNARAVTPLYETFFASNFSTNLIGLYRLDEATGAVTAVDSGTNAFNSTALGSGVAFGNANHIPNTNKTSASLNGSAGNTYIQLENATGTRFRTTFWTLNIWFRRTGAGNASASGSGTGGIIAEPLMMKGGAESETLGVNMNWGFGLEAMGSDFYISADFEKDATNSATKPTGRNGRMCDCSVASNVFTFLTHTTAAAVANPHTFVNGERVRFGGTAITGITASQWYFIVNANQGAGTFQVATTSGGAALTGLGTVAAGGGAWFNHAKATVLLSGTDTTNWHMATNTWDGTNLKTYLDGVLAENEVPTMVPPENVSAQLAAIAAYVTSAGARTGAFNGQLQFASIHSAALTAQNILDLYNNGIVVAPPAAAAPSAALFDPTADDLPRSTMVVQLTDATAIDDASVTSGNVVLKQNGTTLTNPAQYTFAYNGTNDQITLTAVLNGGTFPAGAYTIILN